MRVYSAIFVYWEKKQQIFKEKNYFSKKENDSFSDVFCAVGNLKSQMEKNMPCTGGLKMLKFERDLLALKINLLKSFSKL